MVDSRNDGIKIFVGIDPGLKGGLSILSSDNNIKRSWDFEKETNKSIKQALAQIRHYRVYNIHLEDVKPFPLASKSSIAKMMEQKGLLQGLLIGLELGFELTSAKVWQKHFSMAKKKGETQNSWKKRLKDLAERLEPTMKITLDNADSVLIALYAKQTYNS